MWIGQRCNISRRELSARENGRGPIRNRRAKLQAVVRDEICSKTPHALRSLNFSSQETLQILGKITPTGTISHQMEENKRLCLLALGHILARTRRTGCLRSKTVPPKTCPHRFWQNETQMVYCGGLQRILVNVYFSPRIGNTA